MVRPILQQVAALTKCAEIRQPVISRVAVEMRRRKHDTRHPEPCGLEEIWPSSDAALAISPRHRLLVEPSAIRQTANAGEMRPPAALASTSSPFEANATAQLTPVRRIERTQFGANRHGYLLSKRALDRAAISAIIQSVLTRARLPQQHRV